MKHASAVTADPPRPLRVAGRYLVDDRGERVQLRGFGVGGWMNLENFLNGFPGVEHRLRARAAAALGTERAQWFFDRWADHFLGPADVRFAASLGANVLRLAVNYRHFESDEAPFAYDEKGFARLLAALDACANEGMYAIIDLHAAPGWQNPDWHCDNRSRTALLWRHPHFSERTECLWRELAARTRHHPALCGYDLLNEPATTTPYEPDDHRALNQLYSRLVTAVRDVDPSHVIFLEGDMYGSRFEGLELPEDDNVVWSFHDYGAAQIGQGAYPGFFGDTWLDAETMAEVIHGLPGPRFAARHGVPLWVGEFGAVFAGAGDETDERLRALDDQIGIFEEAGWSWTTWTLKDMGAMGVLRVDADSAFGRLAASTAETKSVCRADTWATWERSGPVSAALGQLAGALARAGVGPPVAQLEAQLAERVSADYTADLLQDHFVSALSQLDDDRLEEAASSFARDACQVNKGYADLLASRFGQRG